MEVTAIKAPTTKSVKECYGAVKGKMAQIPQGENGPIYLQLHHPERRSPTGLCPESPALLSLHTRLCPLTAPLLLLHLLMILWFWVSFTTMMHTWMR